MRNESECVCEIPSKGWQHRRFPIAELAAAQLFGPERWWSNPDQDEVRGNSDGSL